jgi:hypothetical protein
VASRGRLEVSDSGQVDLDQFDAQRQLVMQQVEYSACWPPSRQGLIASTRHFVGPVERVHALGVGQPVAVSARLSA